MNGRFAAIWLLALGFLVFGGAAAALAQEAPAPAPAVDVEAEEPEYSFGTVKTVGAGQIVLSEFDYDTGEEKDVAYGLDPTVELNGVQSVREIAVGDEVDVDYVVKEGKNIAVVLSVAKPTEAEKEG